MKTLSRRWGACLVGLLAAAAVAQPEMAECKKMAPNVAPDPSTKQLKFGPRAGDGRCEGFYVAPVSGENLALVSMTVGTFPTDTEELVLSSVLDRAIHVIAVALQEETYYRMEGDIPAQKTFRWPLSDVVKPGTLRPSDLGVFGRFRRDGDDVYTPIVISSRGAAAPPSGGQVQIVVRASNRFDEIVYQLSERNDCGPSGTDWIKAKAVRGGPSGERVSIVPSGHPTCLLLRGRLRNSDEWRHLTVRIALK